MPLTKGQSQRCSSQKIILQSSYLKHAAVQKDQKFDPHEVCRFCEVGLNVLEMNLVVGL